LVAGLEAGADDYLTKPIRPEGAVRPHPRLDAASTQARRCHDDDRFGDLEIIPRRGLVKRPDTELHLTKTEFRLLCELLAQARGQPCCRRGGLGDGRLDLGAAAVTSTSAVADSRPTRRSQSPHGDTGGACELAEQPELGLRQVQLGAARFTTPASG